MPSTTPMPASAPAVVAVIARRVRGAAPEAVSVRSSLADSPRINPTAMATIASAIRPPTSVAPRRNPSDQSSLERDSIWQAGLRGRGPGSGDLGGAERVRRLDDPRRPGRRPPVSLHGRRRDQ